MNHRRPSKPKVALLDPGIASCTYERELFENHGYSFKVFEGKRDQYDKKLELAEGTEGILIRFTVIDDDFLERTPNLKAIARYGVGYDNIDLDACTRHGVRCAIVRGYGNHSVSDHALALILASMRMLKIGHGNIRKEFGKPPVDTIPELHNQTLGIIGLGCIGSTLAGKAKPLFGNVMACDPYVSDDDFKKAGVEKVTLADLLKTSNVISIHCNLTEETYHLIDQDAFDLMGKRPVVVNTARGNIMNENALIEALESGKIHSAGLDVFNTEIPGNLNKELIEHPRVMATGHYAWYSDRAQEILQKRTADNLLSMLQGDVPEDCLNPEL